MSADKVHPLIGNQMSAVAPDETVWLSASAGTGKTQVLSSRVLRLLLQPGVHPSAIMCLTFTKAGAAEMAERIKNNLAQWVRLPDVQLFKRLEAIGAPSDPATLARARTLFAEVLDCPGGGLRIDTIHAFAQWLLAAFPQEAGLIPGTRPMEDRERSILARQVLADLLQSAQAEPLGDPQLADALAELSLRMGPDDVEAYLLRCAEASDVWFGPGSWQEPMRPRVLRLLDLPADADDASLAALCGDDAFDVASLRRCMEINAQWSAKTGQANADLIAAWLAGDAVQRSADIDALAGVFVKKDGDPRSFSSQEKIDPAYGDFAARVIECTARVMEAKGLMALADRLVPALRLGRAFALAWDEAKKREGLIDFDDQIRQAAALLGQSNLGEWIRYKLDRRFEHVLVDEAQDTNRQQWDIIDALTGDFFAGMGQHGDTMRTLFVVGDYKQAIFRFQGTSPENFRKARDRVRDEMSGAMHNAQMLRSNVRAAELQEYGLDRSFRTSQPLLDFVNRAIEHIGHSAFGLDDAPDRHEGSDGHGYVALWRPIGFAAEDDLAEEPADGEANWLSKPDRQLADKIAMQVRQWVDPRGDGIHLEKEGRRAGPGDIMVLVRKRKELAGQIVASLHKYQVPVAGVDRLRLGAPLAVRDLVAALRFAVQPLDDLNLASLLVSPLIGWSQEDLLRLAYRKKGVHLWQHLRQEAATDAAPAMAQLLDLLGRADFDPPQQLLTWLLTGPWQARSKLVARLGEEANDPINELLNGAFAYAATTTPSLTGFLHWFDAGEGELKREADNAEGLVRVMTVHGSKGLESPIVILADATGDPALSRARGQMLPDPDAPDKRLIPLPGLRSQERLGRVADHYAAEQQADMEEHWRLLYVAMTRAKQALFIGGALGARDRGVPAENSWYSKLRELFPVDSEVADPIWSARLDWGELPKAITAAVIDEEQHPAERVPPWAKRAAPEDPRPPRPLAPSSMGEEDAADPPLPPGSGSLAARRGTLIHKLLERLPDIAPENRADVGNQWLKRQARDFSVSDCEAMLADAIAVLSEPEWAELFAPGSLAEVPVTATIGAQALSGTIDRLLVQDERVLVVDYKTSRRPPGSVDEVPRAIIRQMAAYAATLEKVFPGKKIEAALLYTAAPRLLVLPSHELDGHKQDLARP